MDLIDECKNIAKKLTKKENCMFLSSADDCFKQLFENLNDNIKTIYIPNEGGWLFYLKAKKFGYEVVKYDTLNGIVDIDNLNIENNTLIIVNSSPGYLINQNLKKIHEITKKKNCILINDACGSIGSPYAKIGDVIIFSCGKHKIINNFYGGFICYNNKLKNIIETQSNENKINKVKIINLKEFMSNIKKRIEFLLNKKKELFEKIQNDNILNKYNIIFSDNVDFKKYGVNLFLQLDDNCFMEKEIIIKNKKIKKLELCDKIKNHINEKYSEFEYTLCPRYIRLNKLGISFEIKRLKN
ncbi:hypothetical protein HOC99_03975 [Candidatus Woesearchaeota archaeon]|jgi:hypothetical protein|nr:hypothetical protein [Candidatus Woesearchaeota archaeon]MBT4387178.1 hypothetical protein [Candidatus Woesearchaeota archaeon]MBT4596065.1 hypothetical protein [Candidatus Woesearchaeota archaeon]MBT5741469.1 hypothetical protein [Candidatus Woesearchaeota archaeon]MBT7849070.1 hypothetical protein [Candidatus Woesearchaeota archaeon]